MKRLSVGHAGCYIHDLSAAGARPIRLCEIPYEAAVAWVKTTVPDTNMGTGTKAADLEPGRHGYQWLNKLFVVVADDYPQLALYNHDGRLYVYRIEY